METPTRWDLDPSHPWAAHGIDETMRVDHTMHSVFGASKLAADVLTQEYERYFALRTSVGNISTLRRRSPREWPSAP